MCDILSHLQEGWNESVKNKNKRNKISPYLTLVLYLASLRQGWERRMVLWFVSLQSSII